MALLRKFTPLALNIYYSSLDDSTPLEFAVGTKAYPILRLLLENIEGNKLETLFLMRDLFRKAIDLEDFDSLECLVDVNPTKRLGKNELWAALTGDWDSRYDGESAKAISFLLQRNYLPLRYSLRGPKYHAGRLLEDLPSPCYPLAYASRYGLLESMKAMLNFDPTIVNEGVPHPKQVKLAKTPYDYATKKARELLAQYGGKSWKDLHPRA